MMTKNHATNQTSQKSFHENKEKKQIQLIQTQILQSNTYKLRMVTVH